jgi:ATP-binding protein involved in chromosome partitioning
MADVTQAQIEEQLATYIDPYLERDLVSTKTVKDIKIDGDKAEIEVVMGFPAQGYHDELATRLKALVEGIDGISSATVNVSTKISAHSAQKGVKHIEGIKNIIAVASGKGGVGKSTTAVNLALALSAEGANVGVLDADIYGPSQPRMLGVSGKPESLDGKSLEPMNSYHLQAMSIGFLVDEETPMIWRGPMVTQALQQLLNDTNWKDLDYLVIDLPPGTGDIQLTLAQQVPVSGAVIVTTPQDIALLDAASAVTRNTSSARVVASACRKRTMPTSSARCRWTSVSVKRPIPASPPWSPNRIRGSRRSIARSHAAPPRSCR